MSEPDEKPDRPKLLGAVLRSVRRALIVSVIVFAGVGAVFLLRHPDSPLPPAWNPTVPLSLADPVTSLTPWKLRGALGSKEACVAALGTGAQVAVMEDLVVNDQCGIADRVDLSRVGDARLQPVETSCAIALRTAMWEQHGLQPAAQDILGTRVTQLRHIGSYNCRAMRLANGATGRMSTHARAAAIDISGFTLADGRELRLIRDWEGDDAEATFLRAARDSACDWFRLTLSPDYNSLHADHFHLQSVGWGGCR